MEKATLYFLKEDVSWDKFLALISKIHKPLLLSAQDLQKDFPH